MKFEFIKAKVLRKAEGSHRKLYLALGKGKYAEIFSSSNGIEDIVGKDIEVLSSSCGSRVYGGRIDDKVISDHINNLPEEYQDKAKKMLYSNN